MARDFSRAFYHSKAWKATRRAYFDHRHGLCERCLRAGRVVPGEIVHHKAHLTPANVSDPSVTLSFSNLELLCRDCHAAEHPEVYGRACADPPRVAFDAEGNVVRPGEGEDGGKRGQGARRGHDGGGGQLPVRA